MLDILLIGGGGHCESVIDTLKKSNKYNIVGILDTADKVGMKIDSVEVVGVDDDLQKFYDSGIKHVFITLGSVGDTSLRVRLFNKARSIGYDFPVVVDPSAIISDSSVIKDGSYIGKGAVVNSRANIGECCIINSGSIVEHGSMIHDFCHISPGATISGNVTIGAYTHIGTNATIIQNMVVGADTIIGAGSVVVFNIGSHKKAYGNPCREVSDV